MVLFSIHPVPETLKFCELRGKGLETLAKNSGRVVHSSADFHVSSPSNMSARIPPALTWAKKICNQRKTRLIRHAALPMTMRRRVKKVLMCPARGTLHWVWLLSLQQQRIEPLLRLGAGCARKSSGGSL